VLYYNTVNENLKDVLHQVMSAVEFENFRLVGGTALSLQLGHRMSIDIDLFSDAESSFKILSVASNLLIFHFTAIKKCTYFFP
jgi:Nucleotidyl transferase AbiEii toxin, Type IV TA system